MSEQPEDLGDGSEPRGPTERRVRADAQRNLDALLLSAKAVFAASGVDAPVRQIAERAGVGIGTFYRHFPQRADLIAAVWPCSKLRDATRTVKPCGTRSVAI